MNMATTVEANTPLAQAIQDSVQPKLIEYGWVADESDTTLAEYVTNLLTRDRTRQEIITELGTDLLGVGEDDPSVAELTDWLFNQAQALAAQLKGKSSGPQDNQDNQAAQQAGQTAEQMQQQYQPQDVQMDGLSSAIPSGPRAMRDGTSAGNGRGRGRMLGQLNRQMDRGDDKMLRIKGAAGGTGRINSHSGRDATRRGGRGNSIAGGIQRAMGGRPGPNGMPVMNPQQQMQLMQMMEMQNQMMVQMLNGQVPDMSGFNQPGTQNKGKSLFDRVHKGGKFSKGQQGPGGAGADVEMGEDGQRKDPFDTICRFNDKCTVATCPYAHQSPAAPPGTPVDLQDRCSFGAACENRKCSGKHPSPAQRRQHLSQEVECKFYPNCTNPACPFKHPDMPPCRNGADCTTPDCKFSHSKIMCRYNPCLNPACVYKHVAGQKRGKFEDKVWTADRLKALKDHQEGTEELILPGSVPEQQMTDQPAEVQAAEIVT